MAQNYGLLNDFAQGIKEGLIGYQTIQKNKRDQQQFDLMHGTRTNEAGDLEFDPQVKQQMDIQRRAAVLKGQRDLSGEDPMSQDSQDKRALGRGLLKRSIPGMSDEEINKLIPDTMSGNEIMGENGLIGKAITSGFGMQGQQIRASGIKGLTGVKQDQLEETKNKNAGAVGQEFEKDPIIKMSKTNLNALTRSMNILENPNKPVTAKDFNLAQTDYINAVAAGGAATEGKIHRELPETLVTKWNELKQKIGENDDLRKSPAGKELIDLLRQSIRMVRDDISSAISEQALNLHDSNKFSTNDKVKQTIKDKLKTYNPKAYQQIYGGESGSSGLLKPQQEAVSEITPDVVAYAKSHGISEDAALALKKQRTGGQ